MSIYDLDIKGMRELLHDFQKTVYGRTVFILAYFIPFITFISAALVALCGLAVRDYGLAIIGGWMGAVFAFFFILANIYYYTELRHFCAERNKDKKK